MNPAPSLGTVADLPSLTPEERAQLVTAAGQVIKTRNPRHMLACLIVAFTDNARLVMEVNRLREQIGVGQLPTYEPRVTK